MKKITPNRKDVSVKSKNQYFSEVFSDLLKGWCKANGSTQAEFADVVGVHPNMISRYKKGEAYPTDDVIDWIAQALKVDKSVFFPDKRQIALEEIGRIAVDPEAQKRLERMARITELSDVFQKLQEVYGVPDDWSEKSFAEGFAFIAYLDEQIEHAFKTYFKYIAATDIPEEQSKKIDTVWDGLGEIFGDCLQGIKDAFPQGMTDGQFFDMMESEEHREKVLKVVQDKLSDIGKKQ